MSETTNFVVNFARNDLPYLAAAALIDRKAIAWFDIDGTTVRLCVAGSHLGMIRPLQARVANAGPGTPVSGFGIPAAELPSIVRTALKQGWVTAELNITPDHDTGKFVQDRTVLTGGIPLEAGLFDGILSEDEDEPNRPFVTIQWDRPEALDQLGPSSAGRPFNLATLRECLLTADKLIAANPDNPRYGVLELTNGLASAGTLNLRFCIEAPGLAGTDLRLHQAQLRPLAVLLDRLKADGATHVATSHQHIFADGLTTLYATIPADHPPEDGAEIIASRPNTKTEVESALLNAKLKDPLRAGRAVSTRERVLQIEIKDTPTPRVMLSAYTWKTAKGLGLAGRIQPLTAETTFDILTEQTHVERVLSACGSRIALQANSEWLYIRSQGARTHLTAKIRAYARDHRRVEAQVASLPKLT